MQILGPKTRVLLDYINCLGSRLGLESELASAELAMHLIVITAK